MFSANAANLFLVANNGSTWTSTPSGFTNVYKIDLSTCNATAAASLTEFLTDRTLTTPTYTVTVVAGSGNPKLATGDQVWVAGGTYNVSTPYVYTATLNIYGGFVGTETVNSTRAKGSNTWSFSNETIINGSAYSSGTAAIFTATGDRTGAIFDGMTFTACPTVPAVWVRAATIRYCKFTSNTFTALSLTTSGATTAVCTDCYFSGNSAPVSASNAACVNANQAIAGGTATITNCVFENNSNANTSTGATAGVKVLGAGTTSISNCVFRNNNPTAGYSSAVSLNVAGGSLSNCLIYGNTGLPAIYMLGGTVYNCTVVNNTAGGASLAQTTASPTCNIYNSVFWGTDVNSGIVTVANASTTGDFKYNATSSAVPVGAGLTVSGNIVLPQNNTIGTNAPNFSNPASNDWNLTLSSSLIDIGNGSVSGVPSIDYVNVSRPMGGAYDIGAYEFTISQEKSSNGGFEAALGTYTVAETTTNVLMRVGTTWDATTAIAAPTATATSVTSGLWIKKAPNAAAIKGVVVTTDKHSGTNCLNFKIGSGGTSPTSLATNKTALIQQKTSLLNTLKYTVTFWAKLDGTANNQAARTGAVTVFLMDNVKKTLLTDSAFTITTSWAQYSTTFDIPAHVASNPTADFTTAYVGIGLSTTYTTGVINYSGIFFDDFSLAPALGTTTVSPTSLTGFDYAYAAGPSPEQSFTVGGSSLGSNLLVSPTPNYEVSTTSGIGYQSTAISLAPTSGTVSNTTIYTRLKSGLNAGSYNSENINVGIMGVTNTPKTVACSGTVSKATPAISITGSTGFTYTGLPQGPSTVNAGGSTGTVTYNYVSTDGTTYPASATKPTNAGSYTVTATVAADVNYNQASSSATGFTIAQAPLAISGISIANKVYDGNNTAGISGTAAYSGLVNGESPAIAGTPVATFSDETVGNGKLITVSGYTAPTVNYSITQPTGFTANIYPVTSTFSKSGVSNWSTATEWTYTPIAATDLIISSGELIIDQSPTVHTITVEPGAKLTLATGQTLTATTLTLTSDATGTGTFVDEGTTTITNATVQQYITSGRNWYVSSPVLGATVSSINASTGSSIMSYDEVHGSTVPWVTETGTLESGKGYVVVSPTNTNPTISFSGTLTTGNKQIGLTRSSGQTKEGFNLIGNPYPSYLSWSAVATDPTNTNETTGAKMPTGTMWFRTIDYNGKSAWTPNTSYSVDDVVYNGTRFYKVTTTGTSAATGGPTGTGTGISDNAVVWDYEGSVYIFATLSSNGTPSHASVSNLIPPMQAFWVKTNTGGGTLTFKNTMRTHESVSNKLKAPKSVSNAKPFVRLSISNGASADQIVIYTSDNASNDFDSTDAPKFFNNSGSNQAEIYTLAGTEKLAINALNNIEEGTTLALGFSTERDNRFSLKATEVSNLPTNMQLVLRDKQTNTEFDLSEGEAYQFGSSATNISDRFNLIFRAKGSTTGLETGNKSHAIVYTNAAGQIIIDASENSIYSIYNAVSQLIESGVMYTNHETRNTKLKSGVYVVKVNNQSTRVIVK